MADSAPTTDPFVVLPLPAQPLPIVLRVGSAFIPAIYHPERKTEWLRFERFSRKAKATGAEAIAYATRVLWWRQHRAAEKRRRVETLAHPHYFRFLEAAE